MSAAVLVSPPKNIKIQRSLRTTFYHDVWEGGREEECVGGEKEVGIKGEQRVIDRREVQGCTKIRENFVEDAEGTRTKERWLPLCDFPTISIMGAKF